MGKRRLSKNTYQDTFQNRNKGASPNKGFIDWEKVGRHEKTKFFTPQEDTNKLNLIPYLIASPDHPRVKAGKAKIGDLCMELDIWVHRRLGPNEIPVICPKKNYNKPCPACEREAELKSDGKLDEAEKFRAQRRSLINVQPIIQGEEKPLAIFEVSYHFFMKELIDEANACGNGDDIIPFADLDGGSIIKFRADENKYQGKKYFKFKSFGFYPRENELPEGIEEKALSFDKGLILYTPDEIEKIMYGQDEDIKSEPETKPTPDKPKPEIKKDDKPETKPETKPAPEKNETSENKCPQNHKWGTADDHPECRKCNKDLWEKCLDAG